MDGYPEGMTSEPTRTPRVIRGLDAEQRRAQRREALLAAALDRFASDGYVNTTIEQLCQAAFVSTKSFYEVFSSREDVYKALFTEMSGQLRDEMAGRLGELSDDETETTRRMLVAFITSLMSDPRRARVLYGAWRAITPDIELLRRENRLWAAEFIEGIWRHYGIRGDHHSIAVAVVGGLFDLITLWLIDGDPADEGQIAALIDSATRFYTAVRRGLSE